MIAEIIIVVVPCEGDECFTNEGGESGTWYDSLLDEHIDRFREAWSGLSGCDNPGTT